MINSIAPSFRLVDVMRQVVKSISGLDITAPRFEVGGDFYDNRLLNGNSFRGPSHSLTSAECFSIACSCSSTFSLLISWQFKCNQGSSR